MIKISIAQLPLKEPLLDSKGRLTPEWLNAMVKLQQSINELVKRSNV